MFEMNPMLDEQQPMGPASDGSNSPRDTVSVVGPVAEPSQVTLPTNDDVHSVVDAQSLRAGESSHTAMQCGKRGLLPILGALAKRASLVICTGLCLWYVIYFLYADLNYSRGSCSVTYDNDSDYLCWGVCEAAWLPWYSNWGNTALMSCQNLCQVTDSYEQCTYNCFGVDSSYTTYDSGGGFYSAELAPSCAQGTRVMLSVMGALLLYLLVSHLLWAICYEDFDPQAEMVAVSLSYSLDAQKITALLHPAICTYSTVEVAFILHIWRFAYTMTSSFVSCGDVPHNWTLPYVQPAFLFPVLYIIFTPVLLHAARRWWGGGSWREVGVAFMRLDLVLLYTFLRVMQAAVLPLSLLSFLSVRQMRGTDPDHGTAAEASESELKVASQADAVLETRRADDAVVAARAAAPLSFELRDDAHAQEVAAAIASYATSELRPVAQLQAGVATVAVAAKKLSTRFTVVYSFIKLIGSIGVSLFVLRMSTSGHDGYQTGHWVKECAPGSVFCEATCFGVASPMQKTVTVSSNYLFVAGESTKKYFNDTYTTSNTAWPLHYDYGGTKYSYDGSCDAGISQECLVGNWLSLDMNVILLNCVHLVVQCYYFLHYNNFDPQQNQIDCVQSYTFAGENLLLFLTHPTVCFLSVLEFGILLIGWLGPLFRVGLSCDASVDTSQFVYPVYLTIMEVYKANLAVALRNYRAGGYWRAFTSLLRLDLFVFYGFTLILQTFLFPFSVLGSVSQGAQGAAKALLTQRANRLKSMTERMRSGPKCRVFFLPRSSNISSAQF